MREIQGGFWLWKMQHLTVGIDVGLGSEEHGNVEPLPVGQFDAAFPTSHFGVIRPQDQDAGFAGTPGNFAGDVSF
jgi:hypothetical protein